MQLSPRSATQACAILAVIIAATAVPATSEIQVYPGACRVIDSMDADAWGEAVALIVKIDGDNILESPYSPVSAYQDGPGMTDEERNWRNITIPGLLSAKIMNSRVDLKVDEDPLRAQAWAQATVIDLNILNGTIKADLIKGWANAEAEVNGADTSTVDSNIVGLKVGSLADFEVAPGAQVMLPEVTEVVVGPGSFVKTYVREDASSFPGNGSILYKGDTTVTMLHVYLADVLGLGTVEIIVSKAHAHAEVPTPFCGLVQSVKAASYVARVRPQIDATTSILVGEQHIGVVGGRGHQQLLGAQAPVGQKSLLEVNVSESEVRGSVEPNVESRSYAMSKVLGLCINQDGTLGPDKNNTDDYGRCFIGATAIRAESNSLANATDAISWGSVTIVGLTVAGIDVCDALGYENEDDIDANGSATTNICKPPQNSYLDLGIVNITFNQREYDEAEPGHTGYYVRAVRIQGEIIGDIVVSRAYTSADFLEPPGNPIGPLDGGPV
ncbi:MAG TPA: choice-of-anchor P family protein [Candidatus Thermoplasmatota archaeon]|nr:choice-of-anchor P family protein [Candidatus Thermoplasmatota archaeon]